MERTNVISKKIIKKMLEYVLVPTTSVFARQGRQTDVYRNASKMSYEAKPLYYVVRVAVFFRSIHLRTFLVYFFCVNSIRVRLQLP